MTSTGTYVSETGWNGSGGGTSAFEPDTLIKPRPPAAVPTVARTTPDVAWDANPNTGVSVYDSVGTGRSPLASRRRHERRRSLVVRLDRDRRPRAGDWPARTPLTNAQLSSDLYSSSSSSNFNDITERHERPEHAGPGYDLVTGLGSPKANLLIPALVSTGAAGATAVTSTAAQSHGLVPVLPHDLDPITPPTSTTNGNGSSSSTSSTSSSNSSITPLTPTILAAYSFNGRAVIVVIVVPQPLVANLGPSTAPLTTQAILATVASEEAATTSTHFGQGTGDALIEPDLVPPKRVEKPACGDRCHRAVPARCTEGRSRGCTGPGAECLAISAPARDSRYRLRFRARPGRLGSAPRIAIEGVDALGGSAG